MARVDTFPRTADVMCFCEPEDALKVAEAVMTVQRDWGNRKSRKNARLKYTIERFGLDAFRAEVEKRVGKGFADPKPFGFENNGDRYGWTEGEDGRHHLTLFIQNGRVRDFENGPRMLTGLRRIAEVHRGEFRLTANQNVLVANVPAEKRAEIEALVAEHGLTAHAGTLRLNSMACVALPTCGLALAESERYLPTLIDELESCLAGNGLAEDEITIRMTGCPNGCARPYIAEIGLVGTGPERYNLYLGAAFDGSRLGKLYARDVPASAIVATLDPLLSAYKAERGAGERFGDFLVRTGMWPEPRMARISMSEQVPCSVALPMRVSRWSAPSLRELVRPGVCPATHGWPRSEAPRVGGQDASRREESSRTDEQRTSGVSQM